jgi:hypothetical protein
MKNQELRLGNLVYDHEGVPRAVVQLDNHKSESSYVWVRINAKKINCYPISMVKPIPLTQKWILKAGFKKTKIDKTTAYVKDAFCLIKKGNGLYEIILLDNHLHLINYVHQLQNLFFELMGIDI